MMTLIMFHPAIIIPVYPKPQNVKSCPAAAGANMYVVNSIVLRIEFILAN